MSCRVPRSGPTTSSLSSEVVETNWALVGDRLLPTAIVLERIFGRDFGTETITWKNVTVKEDR